MPVNYDELAQGLGGTEVDDLAAELGGVEIGPEELPAEKPGLLQNVQSDLERRADIVSQSRRAGRAGKQSKFETGLQVLGQGAGLISDVAFRAGAAALKAAAPDPVEDAARMVGKSVIESEAGQAGLKALLAGMDQYNNWRSRNIRAAKNLEAVVNIATLIPISKGTELGVKGSFKLARAGAQGAKTAAQATTHGAATAGKRTLQAVKQSPPARKLTDIVTPIEPGVRKALTPVKETAEEAAKRAPKNAAEELIQTAAVSSNAESKLAKLNRYVKQAEEAVVDYSRDTPLELAGKEAETAINTMNAQLRQLGLAKSHALATVAENTIDVTPVRNQFLKEMRTRTGMVLKRDGTFASAPGRLAKVTDPSDVRLIEEMYAAFTNLGDTPTLQQIDDAVDVIQDIVYKRAQVGAVPINTNVQSIVKSTSKSLNKRLRGAASPVYRNANDAYSTVVQARNDLNKALGKGASKGGSLMKRVFSPTDSGTKKLFAEVKRLTGVDLVEEATFAKFVMESVGDVRQANLLEQLDLLRFPTKGSLINTAATRIIRGLQDPIGKARRIIQTGQ